MTNAFLALKSETWLYGCAFDITFVLRLPPLPSRRFTYSKLNDCKDKRLKYNCWVVVNKVAKEPFETRTGKFMARVFVQDQDFIVSLS